MPIKSKKAVEKSIRKRLFDKIAFPMIAILLFSSLGLTGVSLFHLYNENEAKSQSEVTNFSNTLSTFLNKVGQNISDISKRPMVVNSLISSPNQSLNKLFDANKKWLYASKFRIFDSEARLIYSTNNLPNEVESDYDSHQLKDVVYGGESRFFYSQSSKKLVYSAPIIYYGNTQGILCVDINLSEVIKDLFGEKDLVHVSIKKENEVLASNDERLDISKFSFVGKGFLGIEKDASRDLNIEIFSKEASFFDALKQLIILLGSIIILTVFTIYVVINSVSKTITHPIMTLVEKIKDRNSDTKCYPVGTNDELEILAKSFDDKTFEYQELNRNLEQIVEERTLEYKIASKEAKDALKSRSMFIANMSHEIRTPLNGILGMTELISDTVTDSTVKEKLKIITSSGDLLLAIINDILDFSKMESQSFSLEKIPINLQDLIEQNVNLVSTRAKEKNIVLDTQIDFDTPLYIYGDPTRISQIFLNIIGNGIKFTSKGGVFFSAYYLEKEKRHIFKIRDTGIGIEENALSKLFQPFIQADESTTRKFGGTGLGLSIAKKLIDIMGGLVRVESKLGLGTTFTIEIPFELAQKKEVVSIKSDQTIEMDNLDLKILVAEDNNINQVIIQTYLKNINLDCDFANNGLEAVQKVLSFEKREYDVVFMDLQMPEMDGLEATRKIISQYKGKNIPKIVALTANALPEHKEQCEEAGMMGFMTKPIVKKELYRTLNQLGGIDNNVSESSDNIDTLKVDIKHVKAEVSIDNTNSIDLEVDFDMLLELYEDFGNDGLKGFLIEMVDTCRKHIEEIKKANQQSDFENINFNAHTIKGVVSNFGILEMQKIALELETCKDLQVVTSLVLELESVLAKLDVEKLVDYCKQATLKSA